MTRKRNEEMAFFIRELSLVVTLFLKFVLHPKYRE